LRRGEKSDPQSNRLTNQAKGQRRPSAKPSRSSLSEKKKKRRNRPALRLCAKIFIIPREGKGNTPPSRKSAREKRSLTAPQAQRLGGHPQRKGRIKGSRDSSPWAVGKKKGKKGVRRTAGHFGKGENAKLESKRGKKSERIDLAQKEKNRGGLQDHRSEVGDVRDHR